MVQIIIDDIMYDIKKAERKKAELTSNKAIIATAFATGVQLGGIIANYSGKAISMIKDSWETICNNLTKRF